MFNKVLKIFEYATKEFEIGSGTPGSFSLTEREVFAFQKLNEDLKRKSSSKNDIFRISGIGSRGKIETFSCVGILKVGNKVIQILPKIGRDMSNDDGCFDQSLKNLLYMLSYTKKLNIRENDLSMFNKIHDDFFEVLIYLFAKNLIEIVKNNFRKEYITRSEVLPFIKGKIDFHEQLKINARKDIFALTFDEFAEDNLLNQILKFTTLSLMKISRNSENLKLLQTLNFIFSEVSFCNIRLEDFSRIRIDRLNKEYEPIISLCKLFITKSSLELNFKNTESYSFIFDMNLLFEEFIGEFLRKEMHDTYNKIYLQKSDGVYLAEERYRNGEFVDKNIFKLIPDIQLYIKSEEKPDCIIDTKYKILKESGDRKEGVSQADLYQMNAYSKKYDCENIILLYPKLYDQEHKNVRFVIDPQTSVTVRTVDLGFDLKKEKGNLRKQLEGILCEGKV